MIHFKGQTKFNGGGINDYCFVKSGKEWEVMLRGTFTKQELVSLLSAIETDKVDSFKFGTEVGGKINLDIINNKIHNRNI